MAVSAVLFIGSRLSNFGRCAPIFAAINMIRTYALQKLCNLKISDLHSRLIFVVLLVFSFLVFQLRKSLLKFTDKVSNTG